MGYSTGTATDHLDLLSKFRTFAMLQGWVDLSWDGKVWVTKGVGEQGTDEIYLEFGVYENSAGDSYNMFIRGAMGYVAGDTSLYRAPNRTTHIGMAMWSSQMTYWFIGDSRRLIIVVKVSSKYFCMHAGFLRQIATAQQEPYPLFIAGSAPSHETGWTSTAHGSPWSATPAGEYARHIYRPDGMVQSYAFGVANNTPYVWPWKSCEWASDVGDCIGGGVPLRPAIVYGYSYYVNDDFRYTTYGQIDGIYNIPGLGKSAESIITVGADSYLVIPTAHLIGFNDFAAIKLA